MNDNELIALILTITTGQEAIAGIPGTPIQQAFQPTQQGVPTGKSGFLFKLYDFKVGFPMRSERYVAPAPPEPEKIIHTEIQVYETTFQMSALSVQDPKSTVQYTASDVCNLFSMILQSDKTVELLAAQGLGIGKVSDVQNPYFSDDYARNEANPFFNFTITHKRIVETTTPVIQSTEFQILTV